MSDESSSEAERKRPRLGLLVRVAIYIPLLGFFGWQALNTFKRNGEAADDHFRSAVEQYVQHPPKTIMTKDGEMMPVLELTEDEAVEMGLIEKPSNEPTPPAEPATP